jgi:hypothetical protein
MPAHRAYATTSAVVFALVALVQAARAVAGLPVRIGGFELPVAASAAAAIACAELAVWGWRSRRSG